MGFFFGGGGVVEQQRYGSLSVQSSSQGVPISIVYGKTKVAPNLLWYGNFQAVQHSESVGGKGGDTSVTSYTYTVGVLLGLCEGEIDSFGTLYLNQGKSSPAALGLIEYKGSDTQTPFGYIAANFPSFSLAYRHTAYLATSALDLGNSPYLPQMWVEVSGLLAGTAYNGVDADPALVIQDFLTNQRYGVGLPTSMIDSDTLLTADNSYQKYCRSLSITFSDSLVSNRSARDYLQNWLDVTNSAAVWSGDKLKFVPFGDKESTANGVTFTPLNDPVYDLTDADFHVEPGEEPIVISRADPYDCFNHWRIQYRDANNDHNAAVVESKDQSAIEIYGLRSADLREANFLPNNVSAQMCADLMKNRNLYVRNKYRFKLSWEYALLEPMDIVTITQADLGLDQQPVRILSISEDDSGLLEIEAEEYIEGVQWSPQNPSQSSESGFLDSYADPLSVTEPVIFEPPPLLLKNAAPEVWLLTNGGEKWGGCRVWVSLDGETYNDVGVIRERSRIGYLTAPLGYHSPSSVDMDNTLSIELTAYSDNMRSHSTSDAEKYRSLCYVGGELLSYKTATLTGVKKYNLTQLYRGAYNTLADAHPTYTRFARIAGTQFRYQIPDKSYIGQTIYIKLTSFNNKGKKEQSLDSVVPYTYTINGVGFGRDAAYIVSVSGMPADAQQVYLRVMSGQMKIPAGLAGTLVYVGVLPTATSTFSFRKNGVEFGTIQIASTGAITLTAASETTFEKGDLFSVVAPSPQDATLADISFTIAAIGD